MTRRRNVPRLAARLALVPAVLAAVAALAVPAPASAATATAARAARPVTGAIVIKTTVAGLVIRSKPTTASARVVRLGAAGTKISVNCWTLGTTVAKSAIWYHTVSPKAGYVASAFTSPRKHPVPGLPRCPFSRTYRTRVAGVVIRTGPSMRFKAAGKLGPAGSRVVVTCWIKGQRVKGDSIWYGTAAPFRGFAPGAYLNTGRDPAAGVPHC